MTASNIETATNIVQLVGGQVAKAIGGAQGQAAASLLLGQPGIATSTVDLLNKIQNGTATPGDVADVLQDLAAILAGIAVLTGSSPALLIAVGIAGGINTLNKIYPLSDAVSGLTDAIIDDAIQAGLQQPRPPQIDVSQLDPKTLLPRVSPNGVNDAWRNAIAPRPRDPLAIDLDGDGIETVGINTTTTPILFDHDANGIRTGTGWLQGDDAWLVLDRDGNGSIDSGRELFGVDSLVTSADGSTRNATSGFDALSSLDGNADGVFDANDAAFTQVRLWRDLNQDGISQAGELATLAEHGITGIGLQASGTTVDLGNGNSLSGSAVVTRADGSSTTAGAVELSGTAGNLNLADNPFYREFTDTIPLTAQAVALPEMGASGWVRDMREAASLQTDGGAGFAAALESYAAATGADAQRGQLDALLAAWAGTTGRYDNRNKRNIVGTVTATTETTTTRHLTTVDPSYYIDYDDDDDPTNGAAQYTAAVEFKLPDLYYDTVISGNQSVKVLNADGQAFMDRLGVLEVFNGTRFFDTTVTSGNGGGGISAGGGGGGGGSGILMPATPQNPRVEWIVTFSEQQIGFINQAYGALRDSVYGALVMQTRLRPYLDAIELVIDEQGIRFDTASLAALLESRHAGNERDAILDLVDLNLHAGPTLRAVGFDGLATLGQWIGALPADSALRAELPALGVFAAGATAGSVGGDVFLGDAGADSFNGNAGNDAIDGNAGNDTLRGGDGDDVLLGRDGSDSLQGEAGADVLDGGAGNDALDGGTGNNVYLFGRGDGADVIQQLNDATAGKSNVLRLKEGVAPADVNLKQVYTSFWGWNADLELSIAGTSDKITIGSYWVPLASPGYASYNPVQLIACADGTVWDLNAVRDRLFAGTEGADTTGGTVAADAISGGLGADTLSGGNGDDALDGGVGNDTLKGGNNNDSLFGGEGSDSLQGEAGADVLDGGAGNDTLDGGTGNNVYLFGRGDGADVIQQLNDSTVGKANVVRFKAGVLPGEIALRQVYDSFWGSSSSLELAIVGTGDTLNVQGYFASSNPGNSYNPVQRFEFADGTVWSPSEVMSLLGMGTSGNDNTFGTNDGDLLNGGAGNDLLSGVGGDDSLFGGDGVDTLKGGAGNDSLFGGEGSDSLQGEAGADVLDGGAGNDTLDGGTGNNVYLFGRGDGADVIQQLNDSTAGKSNVLRLKEGVAPGDVNLRQVYTSFWGWNADLELSIAGTSDKITIGSYWVPLASPGYASYSPVQLIEFADGTVWDLNAVRDRLFAGTDGADIIKGTVGADAIAGGGGADTLSGDGGNDVLDGGAGNDALTGGAGNDNYVFRRGYGVDTVNESDTTAGNADLLSFGSDVVADQLWFRRSGSNLEVSIIGTDDKVSISNWYSGSTYQVEQFRTSDGMLLLNSQVAALVGAMAAFAPPAAGQTTMPADYRATLDPVIAANWSPAGG